jgi:UDP-N-acetylglucosamine 2-epimerase (non-hydrolysing)
MTILGTRPEIIRLSLIIPLLDRYAEHILVDTGQNYDDRLSGLFFRELCVRKPDVTLNVRGFGFGDQLAQISSRIEPVLLHHRPDRVLILGDTNSGLAAIVARRLGIPIYHMEAGNRCYDDRVPEESNRRIIDHVSHILMPYTYRSRENLLREGIEGRRIYVIGNPIYEVMTHFSDQISASNVLSRLQVKERGFFLVTMHRAENVDIEQRLRNLLEAFTSLSKAHRLPVLCSLHPRTRSQMKRLGIIIDEPGMRFLEPLGFFDFLRLEQAAFCVLSDSGTVQEESCILGTPNVTIRDVTERPETIECGSSVLAGCESQLIVSLVGLIVGEKARWQPPPEYLMPHVGSTVTHIVLGFDLEETRCGLPGTRDLAPNVRS